VRGKEAEGVRNEQTWRGSKDAHEGNGERKRAPIQQRSEIQVRGEREGGGHCNEGGG